MYVCNCYKEVDVTPARYRLLCVTRSISRLCISSMHTGC